ncbi:MAG: TMEM165/GDT1 family protein [Xanthomonadales bacterium]|nr:TMEM165/GDT1 family protein [Xanthomonadales bacterium]
MTLKAFFLVFAAVFVAELGDKTQLATLLFAADPERNRWVVFAAASSALIAVTGVSVLLGGLVARYFSEKNLAIVAGAGFIVIGLWTLISGLRS